MCIQHPPSEDNVSSSRPEAVGLGAALKAEMAAVVRRFEGQVCGRMKGRGGHLWTLSRHEPTPHTDEVTRRPHTLTLVTPSPSTLNLFLPHQQGVERQGALQGQIDNGGAGAIGDKRKQVLESLPGAGGGGRWRERQGEAGVAAGVWGRETAWDGCGWPNALVLKGCTHVGATYADQEQGYGAQQPPS